MQISEHNHMLSIHSLLTSNKRPETFWRKNNTKIPKYFLISFAIVFLCPSESSEKNPCKQLENGIQARKGGTSNNPKFLTGYVADLPQSLTCKHCKSFLWNCLVGKLLDKQNYSRRNIYLYFLGLPFCCKLYTKYPTEGLLLWHGTLISLITVEVGINV